MPDSHLDLLTFSYISSEDADGFASKMASWGITVSKGSVSKPIPSAPVNWDYPYYRRQESSDPTLFLKGAQGAKVTSGTHVLGRISLDDVTITYINNPPSHYPFSYTLAFRFRVPFPSTISNKDELLKYLMDITAESKSFIKRVWHESTYRPVYWFAVDLPSTMHGISGVLNQVTSPSGRKIHVERAFPDFSYIVYGTSPRTDDFKIQDLSLLSVVAHLAERGYREEARKLTESIPEKDDFKSLPDSPEALKTSIKHLYELQGALSSVKDQYFELRKKLTRTKGLVVRIREKCGGLSEKNLFDLVCDDALTVIEDEISVSLSEVETRLSDINNRIVATLNQLNGYRSQELQRVGILLQSTGMALLVFQVADKLFPNFAIFQGHNTFRSFFTIIITAIAGLATHEQLEKRLR